jgi:CHAT domain-containing protein/tetratricopeptide (TPR) repeat protein
LADALLAFVNADTWADSQHIIEEYPELLRVEYEVETLLEQMETAQDAAELVGRLREHRELLRRCRAVGIPRAFAEKVLSAEALAEAARRGLTPEQFLTQLRAAETTQSRRLADALLAFVNADTWADSQHIIEECPELLREEHEVETLLEQMETAQDDAELVGRLREHRELLRRCRAVGIPRAFAEKVLSAEALAEAARKGLTPDQFLTQLRTAETTQSRRLADALLAFVNADTWAHAQNIIEECPELLREEYEVETLLEQTETAQDDAELVGRLREHRELLCRCRAVGIPRAFAEKVLSAEGLAEAARKGLTPDQFLTQLRATEEMQSSCGPAVPPEFEDALRCAQEAEQHYLRIGDRTALDSAAAAWSRMLNDDAFASAPEDFRLAALNSAGGVFLRLYWERQRIDDLNRALELCERASRTTLPDSPALSARLTNLGDAFIDRFECTKQKADLDQAIRVYQQAVEATPPDAAALLVRLNKLGSGLHARFERTGREADLDELIQVSQQAVQATPPDAPSPVCLNNLGNVLRTRFERWGREADLNEAIRVYRQAVHATPPDGPDLPLYLTNLGNRLRARFARLGQEEDLDEAIRVFQQAVQATAPDAADLPSRLNYLGAGLYARFSRMGRDADLDKLIRVLQQAVQATSPDAPDPMYLTNLGIGLHDRFARLGRDEDLVEAIRAFKQAVQATPPDAPKLPGYLSKLGNCLRDRFGRLGLEADLDEAIRVHHRAVEATSPDSPDLPVYLSNLGADLNQRFARTGREADLDEAIRVCHQAVLATPSDARDLPDYLTNLGIGLHDRFLRRRRDEDLQEAIRVLRQAVQATPSDAPTLPRCLNNLGNALYDRFARSGRAVDLDEAIGVCRQAVLATPPDAAALPARLNNLGNCLHSRFSRVGEAADLEEAIRCYQQAVATTPPGAPDLPSRLANLGRGLRNLFARTGLVTDLDEAIQLCRRACVVASLGAPQVALKTAHEWGNWALARSQWGEAAEAYGYGLATGRQLLARQLDRGHKESWLRDLQEMAAPAAYALAQLGQREEAAVTMERGRARLLAEALQRHRRDLEQLPVRGHEALYRRYRELVERQERLLQPATAGTQQPNVLQGQARLDAIVAATRVLEEVVAEIRKVPGYADFLAESTFAHIQAVAHDTPVVYLLTTAAGGLALIVYNGDVEPVWLDDLTDVTLRSWLLGPADAPVPSGWLGAYTRWLVERTPQAQRAWFAAIDDITNQLWSHIAEPLGAALRQVLPGEPSAAPAITLIPGGLLALLPLHAAWTDDASTPTGRRYFLDEFTVAYAPSALASRHAREGAERSSAAARLLAVEDPLAASATPLPNVHAEVAAIAGLFDTPVILADAQATRHAVRAAIPKADVVHFSCHGRNNWESPLESGLLMADDESGTQVLMTVRDLLDLGQAGGRLATLSACETGLVGMDLPDEVVALPSALLQAGFGGVTASLWAVADISTALLMEHFYRRWREDELSPAEALRAAQRWVRDTTNREKAEYCQRDGAALSRTRMPEDADVTFFTEAMSRDLDGRDFAHPFWWAAFYFTGF